jgi:hypothetical protein
LIVSAFAFLGDIVKPKSFAGIFGAAPSVAIASLLLTFRTHDGSYVAVEARSMVLGAVALAISALVICRRLRSGRRRLRRAIVTGVAVWFAVAFSLWIVLYAGQG